MIIQNFRKRKHIQYNNNNNNNKIQNTKKYFQQFLLPQISNFCNILFYLNFTVFYITKQQIREYIYKMEASPYYKIQTKPTRISISLLLNRQELKKKVAQLQNAKTENIGSLNGYSSFRIFNGPFQNIKIFVMHRAIVKYYLVQIQPKMYFYMKILIIDMESDVLQYVTLIQRLQTQNNKVRSVSVHPNGKQVIIFYQNKIQKYRLEFPKNQHKISQYTLLKIKSKQITSMSIYDLQYYPSGKFLIGLQRIKITNPDKTNYSVKPFTLQPTTFQMKYGNQAYGTCVFGEILYLTKRILVIDAKNQRVAFGYLTSEKICIFDPFNITKDYQYRIIDAKNPSIPNNQTTRFTQIMPISISSLGYLNSTKDGYIVVYDGNNLIATILKLQQPTYKESFNFILPNQTRNQKSIIKCIDILQINSFACVNYNQNLVSISKLDLKNRKTYTLSFMANQEKANAYQLQYKNQDIFYYAKRSELCRVNGQILECLYIKAQFKPNQTVLPLNQSLTACNNQSQFWNPVSMVCQTCENSCKCNNTVQSFNPYYRGCSLDCKKINSAIPWSKYGDNKCVCEEIYQWSNTLNKCIVDCSKIKFNDPSADISKLAINQCKCINGFTYKIKLDAIDIPGKCQLVCSNNKQSKINNNGEPYCECKANQNWDQSQFKCITQQQQTDKRIPGYAIAIIVIAVLVFLLGIIFLLIKKYRKKNEQKNNEMQNPSENKDTQRNIINKGSQISDIKLAERKLCVLCQNSHELANCQSPCGHPFHFMCIMNRIDDGNNTCPQCSTAFHNGVTDFKMLEKQEEVITMQES